MEMKLIKLRIFFLTVILCRGVGGITQIYGQQDASLEQRVFGETTQNTEEEYRDNRFGGGMGQSNSSSFDDDPDTQVKPYEPSEPPGGGQGPRFEDIPKDHQNAPIFPKFKRVFGDCAPVGCDTGRGHTHGTRGRASCHTTGDAIDLHSIRCNGQEYGSNHPVFTRLVRCIQTRFYRGQRWKALHRDSRGNCAGVGPHSRISLVTSCHWDHAHFSLGCWRNGQRIW